MKVKGRRLKMNFRFYLLPFAFSLILPGCATSAMRNGVAQARYEVRTAKGISEKAEIDSRLERADKVLSNWQETYGAGTRQIDDNSLYPVIEQMKSEGGLLSAARDLVSSTSNSWFGILFGASGTGTLLISLILKLLQERGRRQDMENAASDCAAAIETIGDETTRRQVKETVRKRQASRSKFHKLVQKMSSDIQ